jgi:hypothetical protein
MSSRTDPACRVSKRSRHQGLMQGRSSTCRHFQGGPEGSLAPPTRPAQLRSRFAPAQLASGAGRLARKAKTRGRRNRGKSRSRGGFDTGTPRGGSIGLTRPTWEGGPIAGKRTAAAPVSNPPLRRWRNLSFAVGLLRTTGTRPQRQELVDSRRRTTKQAGAIDCRRDREPTHRPSIDRR